MDLLKYLVPMKNAPERFSNLAFWRGVRKLKDDIVHAFEYVNKWGNDIEDDINFSRAKLATWSNTNIDTIITNNGNNTFTFDTNWSVGTTISNSICIGTIESKPLPITMNLNPGIYAIFLYLDGNTYKIGVSLSSAPYGIGIHTYTLRIISILEYGYETRWSYLTNNGKLISFGDSTTYGRLPNRYEQSRYNYPSAIGNALKMSVNNKAADGQGLLKDWDEIITLVNNTDFTPYKLCTIGWNYDDYDLYPNFNLGTINDDTPTTVLGYYRTILDTIQSKNVNMRVILITGYGYPDISHGKQLLEQPIPFKDVTITAREFYEKLEMMAVRHGYTCINQASQPWLNLSNISLIGDNLRPTDDGYKVYSNYIVGRISSLFNPIN